MKFSKFDLGDLLHKEQELIGWRNLSPLLRTLLIHQYEERGDRFATQKEFEGLLDDASWAIEVLNGLGDMEFELFAYGVAVGMGLMFPERVARIEVQWTLGNVSTDEEYDLMKRVYDRLFERELKVRATIQ